MTGKEYQALAMRTASNQTKDNLILNGVLGLNGEAGEIADAMKKHLFQGHELNRQKIIEELGDVLWYIAILSEGLDTTVDEVMEINVAKLKARYPNGFEVERSVNRNEEESAGLYRGNVE